MLRGYRLLIFAACVGLAFIAFGLGAMTMALDTHEQRYQPYGYASDKPLEVELTTSGKADPQALQNHTPCSKPKGQGESDLCDQWRAANAAEESAFWAQWGFWISVIGSSFLLWQIVLTRKAVKDTGKATVAMERQNDIAMMAYRGWVFVDQVIVLHHPDGSKIRVIFKNFGQGPAPSFKSDIIVRNLPYPFWAVPIENAPYDFAIMNLAPNQTHIREIDDFNIIGDDNSRSRISIRWGYSLPDGGQFDTSEDWLIFEDHGVYVVRQMLPIDSANHPSHKATAT